MSGIYVHIPFCKQACHYCDFHFSTQLKYKSDMIKAIIAEIHLRHSFLSEKEIDSIYFGGGTPSLIDMSDIKSILLALSQYYKISDIAEITLEANPDDLSKEKILQLYEAGINRLSIGVQSFQADDLAYMNRAHSAEEAEQVLNDVMSVSFPECTIDLIYGTPTLSDEDWDRNISQIIELGITHISAYALTVERNTALYHFIKSGKSAPLDEEKASRQFIHLMDKLKQNGYVHYEISNFCKPGHQAVHNSNYWEGRPYLGIGPSAHSYDGKRKRLWNIANNAIYMKSIGSSEPNYTEEKLTDDDIYNEFVLTRLRTAKGIEVEKIEQMKDEYRTTFFKNIKPYIKSDKVKLIDNKKYILTRQGKLIADRISSDLFYVNETS